MFQPPEGLYDWFGGAINDRDQAVGVFFDGDFNLVPTLSTADGQFQSIAPPDFPIAYLAPNGINTPGAMVGSLMDTADNLYAFVRTPGGTFTTFQYPGSVYTDAGCINDRGQVAGTYFDSDGIQHGYLREPDGTFRSFDFPSDWQFAYISGINNRGQLVGTYYPADYWQRPFLATPTP